MIDRAVPMALEEEVKAFEKLFQEHARVGITDSHLWLSCLQRPERSTFTRVQRVSCCVALLLLTMMTSALFYQPGDNETGQSTSECFVISVCVRVFVVLCSRARFPKCYSGVQYSRDTTALNGDF